MPRLFNGKWNQPYKKYAVRHAPHNMMIGGKLFRGGQFIPAGDFAKATPEQKKAIMAGKSSPEVAPERASRAASIRRMRQRGKSNKAIKRHQAGYEKTVVQPARDAAARTQRTQNLIREIQGKSRGDQQARMRAQAAEAKAAGRKIDRAEERKAADELRRRGDIAQPADAQLRHSAYQKELANLASLHGMAQSGDKNDRKLFNRALHDAAEKHDKSLIEITQDLQNHPDFDA